MSDPVDPPVAPFEPDQTPNVSYTFSIQEKYDRYYRDRMAHLRTFAQEFPIIAGVKINNTAADLIIEQLLQDVSSSEISKMVDILPVMNPIEAVNKSVGLDQNPAASATVLDVCSKFLTLMKPSGDVPKFPVSDRTLLDTVHVLKRIVFKFYKATTDTIHHNKFSSPIARFRYRLKTKLHRDKMFVFFSIMLIICIIIATALYFAEIEANIDHDYHHDVSTFGLISSIWILYNFIFD